MNLEFSQVFWLENGHKKKVLCLTQKCILIATNVLKFKATMHVNELRGSLFITVAVLLHFKRFRKAQFKK